MAENKKSFLLYCDLIHTVKKMPNEIAGELFKHILSYVNDENPVSDDLIINISFEPIKQQLKRDLVKYESICERNSNNGKLGGRPKNPTEPKKPSGLFTNPTEPKKADNDNDNDNDNDIKEVYKYTLEREILNSISNLFEKKYFNTDTKKQNWLDEIRKLIQIDNETKETIISVIKFAKNDDFWASNLLSINSLRNKNKSGVTKFDQIKAKMPLNGNKAISGYVTLTEKEKQDRNVNINWTYIHFKDTYKKVHTDNSGKEYIEENLTKIYL